MYLDSQLLFSDAQAITATAASTNTLDLGPSASRDIGTGEPLYLVVQVDVAFTDTGSDSTLTVTLQGDSTTTFTPDGTLDCFIMPALTAAGSLFIYRLNTNPTTGSAPLNFQYVRLNYTATNGNLTTGTITSFLTHDVQRYVSYPKGYTIS